MQRIAVLRPQDVGKGDVVGGARHYLVVIDCLARELSRKGAGRQGQRKEQDNR